MQGLWFWAGALALFGQIAAIVGWLDPSTGFILCAPFVLLALRYIDAKNDEGAKSLADPSYIAATDAGCDPPPPPAGTC